MVYIQRSGGYSWRPAMTIDAIEVAIKFVKSIKPDIIVMVDNCYGEFLDYKEPTDVGADLMAGSLIKNPGGGLALSGGYIVGREDLIEMVSYRMTSPGIGRECGLMFGQSRTILQGLFMAPTVVAGALKGAVFCSKLFSNIGYGVSPEPDAIRSDIIQAVKLGSADKVIAFCEGIQAAAPIREPYIVYFQGGLTYDHSKFGAMKAMQRLFEKELIHIDLQLKVHNLQVKEVR